MTSLRERMAALENGDRAPQHAVPDAAPGSMQSTLPGSLAALPLHEPAHSSGKASAALSQPRPSAAELPAIAPAAAAGNVEAGTSRPDCFEGRGLAGSQLTEQELNFEGLSSKPWLRFIRERPAPTRGTSQPVGPGDTTSCSRHSFQPSTCRFIPTHKLVFLHCQSG